MTPRFVDANVFVHAYLKTKRALTASETKIKQSAKSIVSRIDKGEPVIMSVVHFSEISNVLEDNMLMEDAHDVERAICFKQNIRMAEVSHQDYVAAIESQGGKKLGINDALTCVLMNKNGIREIYSFDADFDRIGNIMRLKV